MKGFLSARRHHRQREKERGSYSWRRLDPDSAVVLFNDSLAYRQTDACACKLSSIVQSFEHEKNSFEVFGADSNSMVPY
jgi:hypothetical protein